MAVAQTTRRRTLLAGTFVRDTDPRYAQRGPRPLEFRPGARLARKRWAGDAGIALTCRWGVEYRVSKRTRWASTHGSSLGHGVPVEGDGSTSGGLWWWTSATERLASTGRVDTAETDAAPALKIGAPGMPKYRSASARHHVRWVRRESGGPVNPTMKTYNTPASCAAAEPVWRRVGLTRSSASS